MPDTAQSLADLLVAAADNVEGLITPGTFRNALMSMFSAGNAYAQSVAWTPISDTFTSPAPIALADMDELGTPTIPLTDDAGDHYWDAPAAGIYFAEVYVEAIKIEVGSTGRTPTHLRLGMQVDNDDFWSERHELILDGGRYWARNARFAGLLLHTGSGDGRIRLKATVDDTGGTDAITLVPDGVARAFVARVQ